MTDRLPRPTWLPEVDLRSQTNGSDRVETRIDVVLEKRTVFPWIVLGAVSKLPTAYGEQFLSACFPLNVRDDSCKQTICLFLDLVGARLLNARDGVVTVEAYVPGLRTPSSSFNVPSTPYALDDLAWCPRCPTNPHRVFAENLKDDWELWERLRGAALRITMGPPQR